MNRSFLFVPSHKPKMIEKALKTEADTIIFDFEDSVPEGCHKESARKCYLNYANVAKERYNTWVRVNDTTSDDILEDLKTLNSCAPHSILYPKVESRDDFESRVACQYSIGIISKGAALIESPKGVSEISSICKSHFIHAVVFGNEDYETELLSLRPQRLEEMSIVRALIAMHAKANSLLAVDTVTIDFNNSELLDQHVDSAVRLGFDGKLCLSPKEISLVNRLFSPSIEEIKKHQKILEIHELSKANLLGVSISEGIFVGPPLVKRAKQIIKFARGK